jgi:SAM-dependent methyltransferase
MQERHLDREKYFKEQGLSTGKHIIPYIQQVVPIGPETRMAEIGCGEGGNLSPFLDLGCKVTGIELSEIKIALSRNYFANHPNVKNLEFINQNLFHVELDEELKFDLIFMRDTLEHIENHEELMVRLHKLLKPGGRVFLGFPPWRMPFGGHQQLCHSKFLSKLPWFHLLPKFLYIAVLKAFKEPENKVRELMEIRSTRISLGKFFRLLRKHNFEIEHDTKWLINPNYEIKFGLKPRVLPGWMNIPWIREFYITTYYCIIRPR